MSRKDTFLRKPLNKTLASKILRTVNPHEGFWFYNASADFTGKNARSLKDFAELLRVVDAGSLDFHFGQGDFRRWIQLILGDIDLSVRINRIPQEIRGEKLRRNLTRVVDKRLKELKRI